MLRSERERVGEEKGEEGKEEELNRDFRKEGKRR